MQKIKAEINPKIINKNGLVKNPCMPNCKAFSAINLISFEESFEGKTKIIFAKKLFSTKGSNKKAPKNTEGTANNTKGTRTTHSDSLGG